MLPLLPRFLLPLLWLVPAFLYFKKSSAGLERHLQPLAIGFFLFALAAVTGAVRFLLATSTQPGVASLASPFRHLWFGEHFLLAAGTVIIARWVFYYLLKQFSTQIFIIFTTAIVTVFLLSGLAFSTLLLKSLEKEALAHLQADARIVSNLISARQSELLAAAEALAQNPSLTASAAPDSTLVQTYLLRQKAVALTITDRSLKVLARAHQPEKIGDTLPPSPLTSRLTANQSATNLSLLFSPDPAVAIQAAAPLPNSAGFIFVEDVLDNVFLDQLQNTSGLSASIYINSRLAATALTTPDGLTRPLGLPAPNHPLPWAGHVSLANAPLIAAFLPLSDADSNTIAALSVSTPITSLLKTAGSALQISFILATFLMLLSLLPAYWISTYISKQL